MTDANYQWNKKSARCLRTLHGIKTIGDLNMIGRISPCNKKACMDMIERLKRLVPQILDPVVRTSNNTAVLSTVTGQNVASSGSDEPSRVPVV